MSWHHPDLYFFLCFLAASLAAFLAPSIIDGELLAPQEEAPVVEPRRSTMNEKAVDPPSPAVRRSAIVAKHLKDDRPLDGQLQRESARQAGKQAAERFSWLCESLEGLTLKEQASRSREYFGIVGGARPAVVRGRMPSNN